MSDDLKKELRYYLRVIVTIAVTIISLKLGVKIEPPPIQVQGPVKVSFEK